MATTLRSMKGLAVKGIVAKKARNEAFVTASISGDNMTLVFASQRYERLTPRKVQRVNVTRIVACERRFTDNADDFWWHGIGHHIIKTTAG